MQISYTLKNKVKTLEISGEDQNLYLVLDLAAADKIGVTDSIIVLQQADEKTVKDKNGNLIVTDLGEYEKGGNFVSVYDLKHLAGTRVELKIIEVEFEGVRMLYYSQEEELAKELLTELGVVDIMFVKVAKDFKQQLKAINAIDPQILIPLFDDAELEKNFVSEIGMNFDPQKKLKAKAAEFTNEEYVMQGVKLVLD